MDLSKPNTTPNNPAPLRPFDPLPPDLNSFSPNVTVGDDKPWLPKGRFGRLSLLAWNMVAAFAFITVLILAIYLTDASLLSFGADWSLAFLLLAVGGGIATLVVAIIFNIRRLHDLNQTGWWVLLFFVPFINMLFGFYLMLAPGNPFPNRFGGQRPTPTWEKILGWIYMVFLLLLVLLSFIMGLTGTGLGTALAPPGVTT